MASPAGWSEPKKWFMGIVGSILVASVVTAGGWVVRTALSSPSDQLKSPNLVVAHIGANDPMREGFSSGYDLALPGQQARWSTISTSPSHNPDSWLIKNPVPGAVLYRYLLSDEVLSQAKKNGWRITIRARMLKAIDPYACINANFDTGFRRYDLNITRAFPNLPNNTDLIARLNLHVLAANSAEGPVTDKFNDESRSHMYVMTYDARNKVATVDIDDEERLKVAYSGHTDFTRGRGEFMFSTSTAEAEFELVRFEVFK